MSRTRFLPSRKTLLLVVLFAGVIGGAWWWTKPPPEPVYKGRPLSEWVLEHGLTTDGGGVRMEALRAMGPAAVKWLAYKVEHGRHYQDPAMRSPMQRMRERLFHSEPYDGPDERYMSAESLEELGPEAAAAIPALARALDTDYEQLCRVCVFALHGTGPQSWPAVQEKIAHGSLEARASLISLLSERVRKPRGETAYAEMDRISQIVAEACHDPAPQIRLSAAVAYLHLHLSLGDDPRIRLPITSIIRLLGDSDGDVRDAALSALRDAESEEDRPIQLLIRLLRDELPAARIAAAETLATLDLEGGHFRSTPGATFAEIADMAEQDRKKSAAALLEMTRDPDPECREAAKRALRALGISAQVR